MEPEPFLAKIMAIVESRRTTPPRSYTRELLKNPSKLRKKLNEEAYELNEAHQALLAEHEVDIGLNFGPREHVAREAADVLYHVCVLLVSVDMPLNEAFAVLERRFAKDLARLNGNDAAAADDSPDEDVLADDGDAAAPDEDAEPSPRYGD